MNTTQSMKPLQIKTEYGPPPSDVRWSPHELNAKYPILNKEQWMFTGTRYIAKPSSPRNSLKSDPWFRPLRKWCKDDKVWTKDEGYGYMIGFPMLIKSFIGLQRLKENI